MLKADLVPVLKSKREKQIITGVMMARKKYRCLEGCISQERKRTYRKVLCRPKYDAFMEMRKTKKRKQKTKTMDRMKDH